MKATALVHKSKKWTEILHTWQTRTLDFFMSTNGRLVFSEVFPSLVIILADDHPGIFDIEDWFSCQPEEIGELERHVFPSDTGGLPDAEIICRIAVSLGLRPN
ncbi:MAG: hypothetical protein WCG97_03805 [bacterium]|jgi:hypothetical protein